MSITTCFIMAINLAMIFFKAAIAFCFKEKTDALTYYTFNIICFFNLRAAALAYYAAYYAAALAYYAFNIICFFNLRAAALAYYAAALAYAAEEEET